VKAAWKLAVFCLATASLGAGQAQRNATQRDVFLITIDTLRADHVHCYGYESIQTPALDALAKDGIRFSQAFTPSPITNTSHTSILTGLLPSSHGVTDFAVPLAPTHATLAELLKGNGYHTAAFIGAVILDSRTLAPGLDRGFDFYDNFPEHSQTKARWGRVERRGMEVVQHAEAWMTAHPAGPHFVWIHLYDPHDPYEPPPPYSQTYKDRLYDGEIAYADSALERFIGYLKKAGRYDNALIVVVGDHGEGLGEHHEDTHGIFLYDSTTHVPLIMKTSMRTPAKLPAQGHPDQVVKAQVRTTDILPTIADWMGIKPPARLDGESLKPYMDGAENKDRTAFGETDYPLRFGWAPLRSVRADGFKFIEAPRPELYDLHADPEELANHYQPSDLTVQRFRGMLAEIKAQAPAQPSGAEAQSSQGSSDALKALGYQGQPGAGTPSNSTETSQLPDPKDRIEEQNLLHSAMIASDDNRTDQARHALEKVLQLDPKSLTALRQLGELELHAGDYVRAAEHLKLARDAGDATAAFYEGQAREKSGDFAGARDALEASLKLTPGQFPARLLLGQVYLGLKDPKNAEDQFEAALLLQPESAEAQQDLTRAQELQKSHH
jgi:choline-sulfatase